MNPLAFVQKWRGVNLSERAGSQQHFLDLCEVVDHPKPADVADPAATFTFEKLTARHRGGHGFADVWKKGFFAWEYKGPDKDLDAAYDQLLKYREALENPPLLVVSDMNRIIVRTNFTATPTEIHEITLDNLAGDDKLEVLRNVFHHPERLRPGRPRADITDEAARRFAEIARSMRARGLDPHDVARFLDRIVFCLFAEDIDLLPEGLFSRLVEKTHSDPDRFARYVGELFAAMAGGGDFLMEHIRHFNGDLFADDTVLTLTDEEIARIHEATELDWSAIDPSIFGTLFERGMDPGKRAQIGAHYTSREDIETLVEPVVLAPLRREWEQTARTVRNLLATGRKDGGEPSKAPSKTVLEKARNEALQLVIGFHNRLNSVTVLDPACGSGNFLYVTLQRLKDLEKEVIVFALENGLDELAPRVGPWQLYGIEISPYAYDLAQMVIWIGYLQWIKANGFGTPTEPILKRMEGNFQNKDAILDLNDPQNPREPDWPKVDYIVGNPPFLGGQKMLASLGEEYTALLRSSYEGAVPGGADLCCYWFEKARRQIELGQCERAGLLATQGIRGGVNRSVLESIKRSGDIFFAESDRAWVLEGANVHVSMVAFCAEGDGVTPAVLDGQPVLSINANLTSTVDVTKATALAVNERTAFQGPVRVGPFNVTDAEANRLLVQPNPVPNPNSDVLRPSVNGGDITGRTRRQWVIDFGGMDRTLACLYEEPFAHVEIHVRPARAKARDAARKHYWWRHGRSGEALRAAIGCLERYLAMAQTAKYLLFSWQDPLVSPEQTVIVFARDDDYFFGVLHSRLHEVWALKLGTRLETRPRYTPTTCFETFPFPWPPGQEPAGDPRVQAVAEAARELNALRENWLNPPQWTVTEVLEFPGSVDGPWGRYVHDPDERGIGTVRYPRTVADPPFAAALKKRTLTNLYNQRPTWLDNAHCKLDEAVCAAYVHTTGDTAWRPAMSDEEILEKLLALNLSRAV